MARVLVVDDERRLVASICDWLLMDGHQVESVFDGNLAWEKLQSITYDIVVLDIMLPGIDGIELCRKYRQSGGSARILMLTAKDSSEEMEDGLDAGADDYITKPFSLKELSARVRALMRRSVSFSSAKLVVGILTLDQNQHKVERNGDEVKLLPQEFALLEFLMKEPNRIFSAETLCKRVWRGQSSVDTVRTHIKTLRKKIENGDARPPRIETIHGVGYCLRI